MTVLSTTAFTGPYYPNGGTTAFPFDFRAAATSEVMVVRRPLPPTHTGPDIVLGGYSVTLTPTGGTATFSTPPVAGDPLYILSNPSFEQQTNLASQGAFSPTTVNGAFDKAAIRDIYLKDLISRSVRSTEQMDALPSAGGRLGTILGFNKYSGVRELLTYDQLAVFLTNPVTLIWRQETQSDRDLASTYAATAGTYLDAIRTALGTTAFVGSLTVQAASRAEIAALSGMSAGKQVFLSEIGKIGLWVWDPADRSAAVTSDPYQGLYIAPASAPTGASGAWVRRVDDSIYLTSWWGPPKDGTDAAPILNSASKLVAAAGGGTLKWERSVLYSVGDQALGVYAGYRFGPVTPNILDFVGCTAPVVVDLNGGGMRCRPGMKWGTFNTDGTVLNPSMPYFGVGISTPYIYMVRFKDCAAGQEVINGELDGNILNCTIGGQWGDSGWQVPMYGIWEEDCVRRTRVRGIRSHHHGEDGLVIQGLSTGDLSNDELIEIEDSQFYCNTRQGVSVVQCTGFRARRCSFSWTGKQNENSDSVVIGNTPGAGIDFETDFGPVRQVYAEDCLFAGNFGVGLTFNGDVSVGRFTRCTFIGTTNFAAWMEVPNLEFEDCDFVGAIANAHGDTDPRRATKFRTCRFHAGTAQSPTGAVYFQPGNPIFLEFGGGGAQNVLLDRCNFNTEGNTTARLGYAPNAIYRDCWMKQDGTADSFLQFCTFEGRNSVTSNGTVSFFSSTNYGDLLYNGVPFTDRTIRNPISFTGIAGPTYKVNTTGLSLGDGAETLIRFTTDYATGGRKSIDWLQAGGSIAGQVSVTRDDARNGFYVGVKVWDDTFGALDVAEFDYQGLNLVGGNHSLKSNGIKVVGTQQSAIADPAGGTVGDIEARAAITSMLAAMRNHGLIAT